jgi:hypothetical protein
MKENQLKMVMITYNEATDMEVMEALEDCSIKSYSKIKGTFGKGTISGTHLGNDIWPGLNNIIYAVCREEESVRIISRIKDLRKEIGREGIKAFVFPVEDIT